MEERRGVPALAVVALLLVATATGDEPPGPLEVALSAEGQSPDPAGPARLEASGESDLSTSAHLGKAVTSLAFPGSPLATEPQEPPQDPQEPPRDPQEPPRDPQEPPRDPQDPPRDPQDPPPGSDSGSESARAQRGAAPRGPDVPSQSSESEEGPEPDPDSEEALETQGI